MDRRAAGDGVGSCRNASGGAIRRLRAISESESKPDTCARIVGDPRLGRRCPSADAARLWHEWCGLARRLWRSPPPSSRASNGLEKYQISLSNRRHRPQGPLPKRRRHLVRRHMRLIILACCLLAAAPLLAHPSCGAEYAGNKPVTLTGVVTSIQWTNPHFYFFIDVKDPNGKVAHISKTRNRRFMRSSCPKRRE